MTPADRKKASELHAKVRLFGVHAKPVVKESEKNKTANLLYLNRRRKPPVPVKYTKRIPSPLSFPYQSLRVKDGRDGDPGRDADENSIVSRVVQILKQENPYADEDALMERLLDKIIKDKRLDISHLRNSDQFIFGGTKYKISELMHGGSSGTGGGVTIETPSGDVDASNTVFIPTSEPLWVVSDGIQYFDGAGYTWSGASITMDIPPSQYIRDAI
jgi:hypothetical protein